MLSLAKAKLPALATQFVFLTANAAGLLCGTVYNSNTPDLYANNAHHKIGWIATWIMTAQAVVSLIRAYAPESKKAPMTSETLLPKRPHITHRHHVSNASSRFSQDSGYGVEWTTPSPSHPSSPDPECGEQHHHEPLPSMPEEEEDPEEKRGLLGNNKVDRFLSSRLGTMSTNRIMSLVSHLYTLVDRLILPLGFVALTTGIVTYGGFFKDHYVFTGLAHFIKGGIFLWYGFLTLGRVLGCFAAAGWAWNARPPASIVGNRVAKAPSAEFVESALIFAYGVSDMWLERLGKTDPSWSSTDLEHVAIAIMFFGGGLVSLPSNHTAEDQADPSSVACCLNRAVFAIF